HARPAGQTLAQLLSRLSRARPLAPRHHISRNPRRPRRVSIERDRRGTRAQLPARGEPAAPPLHGLRRRLPRRRRRELARQRTLSLLWEGEGRVRVERRLLKTTRGRTTGHV